mmetsp:Transcript_20268/g.54125  ORF Transcript_20268/g.54125 Transcript_20268/m.54125 type:complete len:373 (-) Transcript_20268:271-1389(-)
MTVGSLNGPSSEEDSQCPWAAQAASAWASKLLPTVVPQLLDLAPLPLGEGHQRVLPEVVVHGTQRGRGWSAGLRGDALLGQGLQRVRAGSLKEAVRDPHGEDIEQKRRQHHHHHKFSLGSIVEPPEQELCNGGHKVTAPDDKCCQHEFLNQGQALPVPELTSEDCPAGWIPIVARHRQFGSSHTVQTIDPLQHRQHDVEDEHPQRAVQREVDPVPVTGVCVVVHELTVRHRNEDVQEMVQEGLQTLLGRVEEPHLPRPSDAVSEALTNETRQAEDAQKELQPPTERAELPKELARLRAIRRDDDDRGGGIDASGGCGRGGEPGRGGGNGRRGVCDSRDVARPCSDDCSQSGRQKRWRSQHRVVRSSDDPADR